MQPANVPDLTARQLHAVLAVAEYNSFIAAAAFLKTSQPALTRTIKRVEDVLGVRLFDRSTRRVAITAAGKEFVAVAERMLNDLRISISSMREKEKSRQDDYNRICRNTTISLVGCVRFCADFAFGAVEQSHDVRAMHDPQ